MNCDVKITSSQLLEIHLEMELICLKAIFLLLKLNAFTAWES